MFFVTLGKIKGKVTPELFQKVQIGKNIPPGIKYHNVLLTLGQYDFVMIIEAPNVNDIINLTASWREVFDTQTMVAVSIEEALKEFTEAIEEARKLLY